MADDKSKEKDKKSKDAATNEGADEDLAKAKKKRLIIIGAATGVAVVGLGAGAAMFLGKDKKQGSGDTVHTEAGTAEAPKGDDHASDEPKDEHATEEKKDEHASEEKKDEHTDAKKDEHGGEKKDDHGGGTVVKAEETSQLADFGQTFSLSTFHLNLGNPLENRYVRLEVSVEYRGGETQKSELTQRTPQLRDAVVSIVSRKTREFLLSPDGKDQLRKEILTRINRYMTKPVEAVYITDILIE